MHCWAQSPLLDKHSSMSAGETNTLFIMVLLRGHTVYETFTGDFKIYIWFCANIVANEQGVAFLTKYQAPVVTWINIFSSLEHWQQSINRFHISYLCRACIEYEPSVLIHCWAQSPLLEKHSSMSAGETNTLFIMVLLRGHTVCETFTGDFKIYIWFCASIVANEQGVAFLTKYQAPVVTWINIFSSLEHWQQSINRFHISYLCRACIE